MQPGAGHRAARIDGIALIVADRIFHAGEPARDQGIDHHHGVTGFGQRGRPVEMEHARGFNEDEQLLWVRDVARDQPSESSRSPAALTGRSFSKSKSLVRSRRSAARTLCLATSRPRK